MRKELFIETPEIQKMGTKLRVHVNYTKQTAQYAFYVYNFSKHIYTHWYSENPEFIYDTEGTPGLYKIKAYIKEEDGSYDAVYTAPIFAVLPCDVTAIDFHAQQEPTACLFTCGSWQVPALYSPHANNVLYVFLVGAVNREKDVLPRFNRWTWAIRGLIPGNVLCLADPTLGRDPELQLSWYLGDQSGELPEELARLVVSIAQSRGIEQHDIIFWGSSGGGFAALSLAAAVEGSTAVAINAQTNAMLFENRNAVRKMQEVCFSGLPEDTITDTFGHLTNMIARWRGVTRSKAVLVQNDRDVHHYQEHFLPFYYSIGGNIPPRMGWNPAGRHSALLYSDPRGHVAETEDMIDDIIAHAVNQTSTL